MRIPRTLMLALVAMFLVVSGANAATGRISVNLIIDNSATLLAVPGAQENLRKLLYHVTKLWDRRAYRDAVVSLVTLNDPRNLFVGSAKDLRRNIDSVWPETGVVINGCSDHEAAFRQVETNVLSQNAERVEIYMLSSLIHSGQPCDEVIIDLPHPMPDGIDLSFLDGRDAKLRIYWAHHLQIPGGLDLFRRFGLKDFRLYDQATSKTALSEGLN